MSDEEVKVAVISFAKSIDVLPVIKNRYPTRVEFNAHKELIRSYLEEGCGYKDFIASTVVTTKRDHLTVEEAEVRNQFRKIRKRILNMMDYLRKLLYADDEDIDNDAAQEDADQEDGAYTQSNIVTGQEDATQEVAGQEDATQEVAGQEDATQEDAGQEDAGQEDASQYTTPRKRKRPFVNFDVSQTNLDTRAEQQSQARNQRSNQRMSGVPYEISTVSPDPRNGPRKSTMRHPLRIIDLTRECLTDIENEKIDKDVEIFKELWKSRYILLKRNQTRMLGEITPLFDRIRKLHEKYNLYRNDA
jgi:hypothetical protein